MITKSSIHALVGKIQTNKPFHTVRIKQTPGRLGLALLSDDRLTFNKNQHSVQGEQCHRT